MSMYEEKVIFVAAPKSNRMTQPHCSSVLYNFW